MNGKLPEFAAGAALVIGGIGAAICRALLAAGSNIALAYRSRAAAADKLVEELSQALAVQADLEQPATIRAAVAKAIEQFGFLHSVVYAAGPSIEYRYIREIEGAEWARAINADVNGCFNLIEATLPHLRERGGAYLAITTAAVDHAPPRDILSAAPKAAIEMLIKGVAREEGRHNIRANCVRPGYIEAGMGLATLHEHTKDYVERMIRSVPLKRAGQPEDVADAAVFLLSRKARYITGACLPVAGGLQLV